jgi:hypothetical protein
MRGKRSSGLPFEVVQDLRRSFAMLNSYFANTGRKIGYAAITSIVMVLSGCGYSGVVADSGDLNYGGSASLSGILHGGQNPISGATVDLYVVGLTGYGSAPASGTHIAETTTDANGNFTFATISCPTAGGAANQLLYLVATGGNSGSGPNPAIKLMAIPAGPSIHGALTSTDVCSTIKSQPTAIGINEVSTVVAMSALAQFYNPSTGFIGTSATNIQGLVNSFNIAGSIMNIGSGNVNATYQPQGGDSVNSYENVTATPDSDKIYLMADILAACVNSTGSGSTACTKLFGDVVPPPAAATTTLGATFTFPAAADTMTAAAYLALNPINATTAGTPSTTKMTDLYNLASPQPPFAYTEAQPTDWTLSVVYGSSLFGTGTTGFISDPINLTVDASGDVDYLTSSATATGAALGYLTPYGGLSGFALSSVGPVQGFTYDGGGIAYTSKLESTSTNRTTYAVTSALSTSKALDNVQDAGDSNLEFQAAQFASDGVFVFDTTATSGDGGSIFQIPGYGQTGTPFISTTATTSQSYAVNAGNLISGVTNASPIAVDQASHVYVAAGSALKQVAYTTTVPSSGAGVAPVSISGTFVTPLGLAVDHSNNVWIPSQAGGSPASGYLSYYNSSTTSVVADSTAGDGGINNPTAVAIDGAGNVWVSSAPTSGTATVSEFALIGGTITPFSPSVGFAHSYATPNSIAVDPSGNVWVANSTVATASVPGTITCILGAASPVVTPIALGVKNAKLAQLP